MTYTYYDQDGNEVQVSAEEFIKLAIESEWTINSEVANALRELLGWIK
jgi:hypothetical protein